MSDDNGAREYAYQGQANQDRISAMQAIADQHPMAKQAKALEEAKAQVEKLHQELSEASAERAALKQQNEEIQKTNGQLQQTCMALQNTVRVLAKMLP